MEAIIDLFLGLERMSPGSEETTATAFQLATQDRPVKSIVEFGCGSGVSTLQLAHLSGASITAIDNCRPFLAQLEQKITQSQRTQQIHVREQSMDADWPEGTSFDLVWCEGSVYAIGLNRALVKWRELLPPGGRIAVSDLVWIDPHPATEVQAYWSGQGVSLCYVDDTVELFSSLGYHVRDHFVFPHRDWLNYYEPLRNVLPEWQTKYSDPENAGIIAQMLQEEMSMYDQFGSQYGYAFFVAERTD